jgi:nucleotide-binding universal stress UspA family protein
VPVKDILVGLAPRDQEDPACDLALSMGAQFSAHVTGIAYALEPHAPFSIFPQFTADLIERHRSEAKKEVDGARARFVEAATRADVRHQALAGQGTVQQATLDFSLRLRTADIAVLTQHQPDDLERVGDLFAEAALFQSGRPMIVVPRNYIGGFSAGRVVIAWDGSVHAARAVAAAMPLMSSASEIEVCIVQEASKGDNLRGNELVTHLRRHGLNAGLAERNDADIPQAIVREAEAFRAALVVMGGYGHSRFREFVFGGVTRLMLSKTPVPVLMAH